MNWSQAKTILIIFFACTNLFLLSTIIFSMGKTTIVSDNLINYTVDILHNNRIEIDSQIIPKRLSPVAYINAKNVIEDYESFSKKFLGEDSVLSAEKTYSGEIGTVRFYGDRFNFMPSSPVHSDITRKLKSYNADTVALSILKKYGINDNNIITDYHTDDESTYIVNISKKTDNMLHFNSCIEIIMTKDGVSQISGSWFIEEASEKEKITLKNITSVLIDYISLTNRPSTHEKIVSLEQGYSSLESGIFHSELVLTPCWKITLDDGQAYILNATESSSLTGNN